MSTPPHIRRSYIDSPYGQTHLRAATPTAGAGRPTVICFHHSPHSSEVYRDFLPYLGTDRRVVAPDTPGFGESDGTPGQPSVEDYAGAMLPVIDAQPPGPIDLIGYHTGSLIAIETALLRPQRIRRLLLVCIPVINAAELARFEANPWPPPVQENGGHLDIEWKRSVEWRDPNMTMPMVAESFARKLRAGDRAFWGGLAAYRYATAEKLPQVSQEILAVNPRDDMYAVTPRAAPLIRSGRLVEVEPWGYGMFYVYPREIADYARAFFDRA